MPLKQGDRIWCVSERRKHIYLAEVTNGFVMIGDVLYIQCEGVAFSALICSDDVGRLVFFEDQYKQACDKLKEILRRDSDGEDD